MKNHYTCMHHPENGYIFPFVLFSISLFMLFTFHQIIQLETTKHIFDKDIEQYKLKTLYQIGLTHLHDMDPDHLHFSRNYSAPHGEIFIEFVKTSNQQDYYFIHLNTNKGSYQQKHFKIPHPDDRNIQALMQMKRYE